MRLRLEKLDREKNENLIKEVKAASEGIVEPATDTTEFGSPDRSDEEIANEREQAEANLEKTSGLVFVTEAWITKMLAHGGRANADLHLDVLNDLIDPAKPEEGVILLTPEPLKMPIPKWLVRTGVKEEK